MDKEDRLRGEETQKKFLLGVHPNMKDRIDNAAKALGIKRSEWIRSAIIAKLEKDKPAT